MLDNGFSSKYIMCSRVLLPATCCFPQVENRFLSFPFCIFFPDSPFPRPCLRDIMSSTLGWLIHLLLLLSPAVHAARSTAARAQDEVPRWQMWGPYRPSIYFGVRPQMPETFLMGLMWASGRSREDVLDSTYTSQCPLLFPSAVGSPLSSLLTAAPP